MDPVQIFGITLSCFTAGCVLLCIVGCCCYCCWKKKEKNTQPHNNNNNNNQTRVINNLVSGTLRNSQRQRIMQIRADHRNMEIQFEHTLSNISTSPTAPPHSYINRNNIQNQR